MDVFISYFVLSNIGLGIITSAILLWKLRQSITHLTQEWRIPISMKKFHWGIFFLFLFLTCELISESVSEYLASKSIYNSYIFSIDFTLSTLLLFGFFYINTQKIWKRYAYPLLYAIIVIYLLQGGYYDPNCVHPSHTSLLIYSIYFLAALLHLTELLLTPKSIYFGFQLKISLIILVYSLISVITTSFHWAETLTMGATYSKLIFYIHAFNIISFYLSLTIVFIQEIFKLGRKSVKE